MIKRSDNKLLAEIPLNYGPDPGTLKLYAGKPPMKLSRDELLLIILEEYGDLSNVLGSCEGICLDCGYIQPGVEPDARNYICEDCGADQVFGIEDVIITLG
jgi:hypothetical protein